ncbi:hypothetical protein TRFO_29617 [Tritrichomonas foetus]|uniref:Uncharacterized protein n=1 Tax=Tritrichomonas foetus TaxID=1144522 RepID=A0A1J4JWK9_9EUKA|nr:hypothetical protein TRFO_29617 [Tritrichomonas foetus]|eukprot:OHT03058.1 hypothetical protein TRFO_29617 [Tritrichomonas foetus]
MDSLLVSPIPSPSVSPRRVRVRTYQNSPSKEVVARMAQKLDQEEMKAVSDELKQNQQVCGQLHSLLSQIKIDIKEEKKIRKKLLAEEGSKNMAKIEEACNALEQEENKALEKRFNEQNKQIQITKEKVKELTNIQKQIPGIFSQCKTGLHSCLNNLHNTLSKIPFTEKFVYYLSLSKLENSLKGMLQQMPDQSFLDEFPKKSKCLICDSLSFEVPDYSMSFE